MERVKISLTGDPSSEMVKIQLMEISEDGGEGVEVPPALQIQVGNSAEFTLPGDNQYLIITKVGAPPLLTEDQKEEATRRAEEAARVQRNQERVRDGNTSS